MALPNQLGHGGTGFHGDDAVRLRTTLSSLRTLGNEIKADHNDVLAKLDLDSGVTDTNYAATRTVAAADVAALPATLGQGGSFLHGNDGIATRLILEALRTLANEIKADHNGLVAKLDLDGGGGGVTDTDYGAVTATDEVQLITLDATGGTFTATYDGQTTEAIAYNATAATVQTELEQLSNIEVGDVVVTGSAGGPYTLTFGGNLADENVAAVTCSGALLTKAAGTGTAGVTTATAGAAHTPTVATTVPGVAATTDEVQTVTLTGGSTTGTWDLVVPTYGTIAGIAYNASGASVQTSFRALHADTSACTVVRSGAGTSGDPYVYTITYLGTLAQTNVAEVTVTPNALGINEVQHVTVTGNGGTFTITYSGQTTDPIAYNATAGAVQTALLALSNLDTADVVVTGGPGDATGSAPYVLTFGGTLAATNVAAVTTSVAALMAIGTAVPSTTTPGVEPKTVITADVAAIKADFGAGGANLHGQDAIALDVTVSRLITMLNEAKRKRNALLAKLDLDGAGGGVIDTNYAALHATTAADAS